MAAPDINRLRADLVQMLMSDRRHALQQRNASAAITASTRIADLLLGRLAEEEATKPPVTQITHVLMHQIICPLCKERSAISATPPPREPEAVKPRRASAWDDVEPEPEPASLLEPVRQPRTIAVPKVVRKRDARVRGLA